MKKILLMFLTFQAVLVYSQDESVLEEEFQNYFLPETATSMQLARNLDFVRYRLRGYDNRYGEYANLIDLADGSVYWGAVSALNAIKRVDRTRISYSSANANYRHRTTVATKAAGTALQIDRRWGENGFVEGLGTDSYAATAAYGKVFSRRHTINAVYSGNFGNQDVRSAATEEVYLLARNNYYNPNSGIQNGEARNAKTRSFNSNFAQIDYTGSPTENLTLTALVSGYMGEEAFGLLSWYDAPTPYPDYYRSLPGFFGNAAVSDYLRDAWSSGDKSVTQIDWRTMYEANIFNEDKRSHYIMKELVTQKTNLTAQAGINYKLSKSLTFNAGAQAASYNSLNFARLADLLGGNYWTDIDQYLLDDEYYGDMIQNNVREPGRKVLAGEKFGYNYNMESQRYRGEAGFLYRSKSLSADAALAAGRTTHTRTGNYEKETFPGNKSYGKSHPEIFREYSLRAGASYYVNMRNILSIRAMVAEAAPLAFNVFISPEYRNQTVENPENIRILEAEAGYSYFSPGIQFSIRGYATRFGGDSYITSYYDDPSGEFANLVMTGIDKLHCGAEAEAEFRPDARLTIRTLAAWNIYRYASNPRVDILRDKDAQAIVIDSKSYLDGYRVAGTPQSVAVVEMRYAFPGWYYASVAVNYAGDNYVAVNPLRRMSRVANLAGSPELKAAIMEQESLGSAVTLNLSLSKEFRFQSGHRISFWAMVNNILDNRNIKYGGYEQMRFSHSDRASGSELIPFPSKFYYAYGTNYYATIGYIF